MNLFLVLRDSWYFFSRNCSAILRLCLPLIVLEAVLAQQADKLSGDGTNMLPKLLVGLLFYPLYSAALILFLAARSNGLQPRSRDVLAMSLRLWPSFALLCGLSTCAILLGLSLFVLPGLWLMVKLAFAEFVLVLEQRTPLQALQQSYVMTRTCLPQLLGWILLVMIPIWLLENWLQIQPFIYQSALNRLLADCFTSILQLFSLVVLFRLFMLQRVTQNTAA